jgi:hypothetical protein
MEMSLYITVFISVFISLVLVSLFVNLPVLKLFRNGLRGWSKILPFVSICVFILLLTAQFLKNMNIGSIDPGLASIGSAELVVLTVIAFTLFSFYGNLIALFIFAYLLSTHLIAGADLNQLSMGLQVALAALLSVFILGDRQPFLNSTNVSAYKLREFLVFSLAVAFMGIVLMAAIQLNSFQTFLSQALSLRLGLPQLLALLVLVFAGWFSVASGLARPLVLMALAIPSVLLLGFCLSGNFFVLSLIFLAILCLAMGPSKQVV